MDNSEKKLRIDIIFPLLAVLIFFRAFRYIFARFIASKFRIRLRLQHPSPLAKDTAPIPNALETETEIGNGDGK